MRRNQARTPGGNPYAEIKEIGADMVSVRVLTDPTEETLRAHLADLAKVLDRDQRFGLLLDMTALSSLPSPLSAIVADWLRETAASYSGLWKCTALVISAPAVRGAWSQILQQTSPYLHVGVFQERSVAEEWLVDQVRQLDRGSEARIRISDKP